MSEMSNTCIAWLPPFSLEGYLSVNDILWITV